MSGDPHRNAPINDLETVLFDQATIQARIKQLGAEINACYQGRELVVIAIINGAVIFVADLIRELDLALQLDCIRVSSYRNQTAPVQAPEIIDHIRLEIENRHVLLIDDILDTGNTLTAVRQALHSRHPASLRTCVLLDKQGRRTVACEADFVGFRIPDQFVVGYGLDFAGRYRQLPCIGVLKAEHQSA